MNSCYDVIAIGAGAAGMAAAIAAARRQKRVLLAEKGDRTGRKISASGNGRCNLMNTAAPRYYGDTDFALQVLQNCPRSRIASFFNEYGLMLTEEGEGRIYPATFQSASVIQVLTRALESHDVTVARNTRIDSVIPEREGFVLHSGGKSFEAEKVIVACGGAAQPRLGGCSDGYAVLRSLGHRMIAPEPVLVPLVTDPKSISGLSGIRVRCRVTVLSEGREVHREEGEVLFTDYGVSGICIMQCARFTRGKDSVLELDLIHSLFADINDAVRELRRRADLFAAFSPVSLLEGMLPSKLAYAVLKQAGIPLRGEKVSDLSGDDLERITRTAYAYRIRVEGSRGMDYAQVTAGGADCREFCPYTMASLLVPGLYAAGEVLNVDGDCGGFNLMFAFASGILAGNAV